MLYIGLLVLLFVTLYYWRYPRFGLQLYKFSNWLDIKLAGLKYSTADIDGMQMHYLHNLDNDDKPALILLHGFTADKTIWLKMARKISKDTRLIIPDLAGHGYTGFKAEWDYSIAAQAQRVVKLMDKLGLEKAHLAGNSMGGFISAYIAAFYPDKVDSLVLINSAGIHSKELSEMNKMIQQGSNPFIMDHVDQFERFYAMTMARPPFVPQVVKHAMARKYVAQKEQLIQIFKDFNLSENMLDDKMSKINVPTLVIWGEQDKLIHVSAAYQWQQGTDAKLIVWPDLGHMPMAEAPGRTAREIKQLIGVS